MNLGRRVLSLRPLIAAIVWPLFSTVVNAGGTIKEVDQTTLITVVVPSLPNPIDTSAMARTDLAVVRQFEKDFPDIFRRKYLAKYRSDPAKYGNFSWDKVEVRVLPFSGLNVEGVENDLMAIAGGNPPDVLYVNFRKSDNYIRNGFLYPLDRPEDGYFPSLSEEEKQDRIHPKVWPVIHRKGPDGEKHVWVMPWGGFLGRVLAYRKDLFDEVGIPYPTAEWTWEDMYLAAKKLTDPTKGRVGLILCGEPGWEFSTFLWSAGGEVMVYDEATDLWSCTFGSKEAAVALDYYIRLTMEPWRASDGKMARGYVATDPNVGYGLWDAGQAGMNLVYIDQKFFANLNPDLVGLVPVPKGPTGQRGAELNSRMLGLFAKIKDPAVRDAAWEYIAYQDSEAAAALRTKMLVESGLGRFVHPKQLERFGYPEVARFSPKGWMELFDIVAATGHPEPYGMNSNLAYRLLAQPVGEATELALQNALPSESEARLKVMERLLSRAEAKANDLMMGMIPPEERRIRNLAAIIFLALIAVGFGLVFLKVFQIFGGKTGVVRKDRNGTLRRKAFIFVLLAPALGSIALWNYYPLVMGSVMGFQDYRILGDSSWVGVKHFGDILWDSFWWQSLWNSLRFSFIALVFGFIPPVILAILLQEVPRGKILYRILFYLPAMLAGLVTLLLWKQFFDPTASGLLNIFLSKIPAFFFFVVGGAILWGAFLLAARFWLHRQLLAAAGAVLIGAVVALSVCSIVWPLVAAEGISGLWQTLPEPIQWLRDSRYALISCIIPGVWAGLGPGCLIYLAALKGIPDDYYEAAEIDGASFLDKVIAIVLPSLRMLLLINFVGAFIGSWVGSTDAILAMTGGRSNTEVAPLNIFYKAFVFLEFGPATAMAWMLGFLLIGFTVYQLRVLASVEFRATGGK